MGISRISHKKGFRYFSNSLFSPSLKTLTTSSSITPLYLYNSSTESPRNCSFDCNTVHKQPSLLNSSCGLPSNCNLDSIPLLNKVSFCISSSGLSSKFHIFHPFSQSLKLLTKLKCSSSNVGSVSSSFGMPEPYNGRRFCRLFSVSSSDRTLVSEESSEFHNVLDWDWRGAKKDLDEVNLTPSMISKAIEIIKSGDDDMESKLRMVGSKLSIESINGIFKVLNCQRISGLRFFRWVRIDNQRWHLSAEVCSLIINNCGCLDDYESMRSLLDEFKSEKICLGENAFSFLTASGSIKDLLMKSVRRLINLLNEVGGSCRNSGICALIEMFCNLDSFEMAKFVIEITEKKDSYYNILARQRCKRGHFEEVYGIIRDMGDSNVKTYNYLLGSLCKNGRITEAQGLVEEMEKKGVRSDTITFEILIHNSCINGKVDLAKQLLDKMVDSSLEPRISTHAAFLKALFGAEQYEEARDYVIDSSVKYKQSSSAIYSLFADLHRGKGDLMAARRIIIEMMDKGLRPNFRAYINIVKQLRKTGRGYLASDLKNRYSSF